MGSTTAPRPTRCPIASFPKRSAGYCNDRRSFRTVCVKHGGSAPQVKRKAAERLADLIDPDRALREAAALAYSNLQDLLDDQGQLLPAKDWPRWAAAAVSSLEVTKRNLVVGDGAQEDVVKIRLWDKTRNLENLLKHLGLLKEQLHLTVADEVEQRLEAGRQPDPLEWDVSPGVLWGHPVAWHHRCGRLQAIHFPAALPQAAL